MVKGRDKRKRERDKRKWSERWERKGESLKEKDEIENGDNKHSECEKRDIEGKQSSKREKKDEGET